MVIKDVTYTIVYKDYIGAGCIAPECFSSLFLRGIITQGRNSNSVKNYDLTDLRQLLIRMANIFLNINDTILLIKVFASTLHQSESFYLKDLPKLIVPLLM